MASTSGWHRRSPSAELRKARDRKYNSPEHRGARKHWAPIVAAGQARCWRCGHPIAPGSNWDIGHNDVGTQIMGPEHRSCNARAAASKGARIANSKRKSRASTTPAPASTPAFRRPDW